MTLLCYGDSITEGNMLPEADRPSVWPALVQEQSEGRIIVLNEGKGGRPTASLDEFREVWSRRGAEPIDALLLALGANDARDLSETCVPQATRNLRRMIAIAREIRPTCAVVVAGPTRIRLDTLGPTKPVGAQRDQKLRELNQAFARLAEETGCHFVSLYGVLPPESLAADGVHPDAAGNRAIAAAISGFLAAARIGASS